MLVVRFLVWLTPSWLWRKFQLPMPRRIVRLSRSEVDRQVRENAGAIALKYGRSELEEELVEWQKNCLDAVLHPESDRFDKFGRILRPRSDK